MSSASSILIQRTSLLIFVWTLMQTRGSAFVLSSVKRPAPGRTASFRSRGLFTSKNDAQDGGSSSSESKEQLDDFEWRAEKIRLEEQNTRAFLKRRPRKLPYEDARMWVQANLGADTEEEFLDLVENGNLRTPYIPKRPEEWYTNTKEWISWEHFLRGIFDDKQPSGVRPASGVFD